MAAELNITIEQGATFPLTVTTTALNLTGWTARMQGRATHASTAIVLDSATNISLSIAPAANSVITVTMTPAATAALAAPASGVYDLEVQNTATGEVRRLIEGSYTVTPEVTR